MKKTPSSASGGAPGNRRGSPEAVQKRRLARKLNSLLTEGAPTAGAKSDGRTERRRKRLLKELEEGTRVPGEGLKPIEVLQHVHELLELGETPAALRKVAKVHPRGDIDVDEATELLRELHASYGFHPEAYPFLGLPAEALAAAGIGGEGPAPPSTAPRRGRPPKRAV